MHKFQAHAATDVTGFGLLGHANNLAMQQRSDVAFVIHNLPIIAKMTAISKAYGNAFRLLQGLSAETSGTSDDPNCCRHAYLHFLLHELASCCASLQAGCWCVCPENRPPSSAQR